MKNVLLALCLFLANTVLLPAAESQELVVNLSTENSLLPVYVAKLTSEDPTLPSNFLTQLEDSLLFDLNYNGMTFTLPRTSEKEKLAEVESFQAKDWHTKNVFHVVKVNVAKDRTLFALLFSVNSNETKEIGGVKLSGEIQKDRAQIHRLADAIYDTLFHGRGIARSKILYTIKKQVPNKKGGISEVWEADYDGHNSRKLLADGGYQVTPVYLPAKDPSSQNSIFYVSYLTSQPKIYFSSQKEGKVKRLTYLKGNQLMPAISKQRDNVAFICDITGNPDLFLQPFNPEIGAIGKPRQIFAAHRATQGSPTFSPDGKQIAFVSNKDGSPRVYVIHVPEEGASLKNIHANLISKHCKESSAPAWSPDGNKLAYCSMTGGTRQIWVYDFKTKEEKQLTTGPGNKENPSWAPNSLCLIYNTNTVDGSELFLTTLHQAKQVKISSGIGEKRFPNWGM